jgi:multidrug efflux pump subunit AcrB
MRLVVIGLALVACKHTATTAREHHETAITVKAALPGASPETMASSVTTPLERQLGRLEQLAAMESTSTSGNAEIVLEFADGTQLDAAARDVQAAIDAASNQLPQALPSRPIYQKAGRTGAVMRVTFASDRVPIDSMSRVTEHFAQKLSQVAGVGRVETCGDSRDTIRVLVDPLRLLTSQKSIEDVLAAVRDPTGAFEQSALLRDVARITREPTPSKCRAVNTLGRRVIALTVTAQSGADSLAVRERLEAVLEALKRESPPTIEIAALPRTRPMTYRLRWSSDVAIEKRTVDLDDLVNEIHGPQLVAELGEFDRDIVEVHVAGEVPDIVRIAASHGVTLLDPHDHVIGLEGPDPAVLEQEAAAIRTKLKTTYVLGAGHTPETSVKLDRDKMAQLGIVGNGEVEHLLYAVSRDNGMPTSFELTQSGQTPIVVTIDGKLPEVLDQLYAHTATGVQIPLSQIATVTQTSDRREIIHHGQFPWIGVRVSGSVEDIASALGAIPVPAGTQRDIGDPQPQ